jgi:hypothetical protein
MSFSLSRLFEVDENRPQGPKSLHIAASKLGICVVKSGTVVGGAIEVVLDKLEKGGICVHLGEVNLGHLSISVVHSYL